MRPCLAAAALLCLATAAQAQVKIGLSAPLTGPDAAFGQGLRGGAEQAVADLNKAGGVNGQRLVLVAADDAGDGKQGLAVVKKFAADRVSLVVGPLNAAVAALAIPAYAEAGIVAVTPGTSWAPLTARGQWNVFRPFANDSDQSTIAGAYLAEKFAGQRIGLVHDKTTFGRGLVDGVARALKAAGQSEAAFETLTPGERDLSALAARLKRARIAVVYFGGLGPEAGLLVKAMREAGLDAPLVGSDGLLDKEFLQAAGAAADGTVMTLAPERRLPDAKGTPAKSVRSPEADTFAAQGYAAVEVLALGIGGAKSADAQAVAAFLHRGLPLRTAIGEIAFDATGDLKADPRRPAYTLQVWRRTPDGRIDYAGNAIAP
ncbi:branched-chain amino acid ABC transporter substrate-binding protein [Methylobacterium sp. BTF04]|uniref:branched-chain amino acid ABC transporter substrate-binding protein n=1 Tax=Methylobacterium sp. BTF04 TaxID=2708300 RepID=UPI0013D39B08|nr:branched-chain amino acid ABC transporter substrate-binding protein [Methylobacterium sp. BTF04]NEU13060.1 branched-chain amino acid ABC transporter substrate-binding protein [Methylobacterium sp. BTF04]